MKSLSLLLLCVLMSALLPLRAQKTESSERPAQLKPILVDREALSGVGLKKVDLKDEPNKDFFQKGLYRGEDISVYIVSSESWKSDFKDFWFDEFICILHGQARIHPVGGTEQMMYAGDLFFAPKGYTGEWEIQAGDQYHYELSVITTQRAPKDQVAIEKGPVLLDRARLSGTNIKLDDQGQFSETLVAGPELTISLHATRPNRQTSTDPMKEQMIHVLSGQLNIGIIEDEADSFFTGDYIIIPKGFIGFWESKGHGIVKYLSIEKSVEL